MLREALDAVGEQRFTQRQCIVSIARAIAGRDLGRARRAPDQIDRPHVDDRGNLHAARSQPRRCRVETVVVAEQHGTLANAHAIAREHAVRSAEQHDAGTIIVDERDRALAAPVAITTRCAAIRSDTAAVWPFSTPCA